MNLNHNNVHGIFFLNPVYNNDLLLIYDKKL